jgi:hypothetical protein
VESLVKLALFLLVLPFILAYYIFRWTFMAFRPLWKSNLDPRVKWAVTGGVALLVVASVVFSSQPGTPIASTQVQAAVTTPTVTPADTTLATPSRTPAPTAKPVAVPVAPKATVRPTQKPPPPPPPPPPFNYCGAPANPWHYNFCGGSVIYSPPSSLCSYFDCIASFWHEDIPNDGYVAQCADSTFSLSGGEAGGVCSYHGGPRRPLYAQ